MSKPLLRICAKIAQTLREHVKN